MLTVTQATEADVPALALLMDELDRFYGAVAVDSPEQREEQIRDALFGSRPAAYALLAEDDGELLGFASYSLLWPAAGAFGTSTGLYRIALGSKRNWNSSRVLSAVRGGRRLRIPGMAAGAG